MPSIDIASVAERRWFHGHAFRALEISRRLRGLQHELSGALVAAQTSSVPGQIQVGYAARYAARDDEFAERLAAFVSEAVAGITTPLARHASWRRPA
ncbi:MAG: hypothetical protein ACKO91_08145 [Acidimicrobiales bacterium]